LFTHDQQIVSSEGITPTKIIIRIAWKQLGVRRVDLLGVRCALDGGDCFPLREGVALLGAGLGTNMAADVRVLRSNR
jgi:arginine deiminase